ncbi:hypothetical protein Bca4012_049688 [Brassica carinata]|uniref:Uncharacterized protein n=2 Tax=Brassica TaxID=3705 RepID=A0A8X7R4R3_BRACI|nr:hypothetical protein Bca52824_052438 [Brassica carinata]
MNLKVLECLPVHESPGAGSAQRIRQDSIGILIGPTRQPHRRSPGLLLFLKNNSNKQSIETPSEAFVSSTLYELQKEIAGVPV